MKTLSRIAIAAVFAPLLVVASSSRGLQLAAAVVAGVVFVGVLAALPRADGDDLVVDLFARKLRRR